VPGEKRRLHPATVALLCAAVGGGGVWAWCDGHAALDRFMIARGHHTIEHTTPTARALLQMGPRWLAEAPAPRLDLDIAFKNVEKLRQMQRDALRKGHIDAAAKETVAADLTADGARSRVKLRLKGDNLDHVSGRRVSFRVEIERGPPVLGMREFSLQAPATKGYHLEALFHESVRWAGVLSPRYEFVRVGCNGDEYGVTALEEHCAKEMLERQGRRESVIVRFEEEQMFAAQIRLGSTDARDVAVDDYRTAPVKAMGSALAPAAAAHALGLLRAFVAGTLPAAQVFDVEALASYLAVCELWGVWHPLRWHNLRFYFDPVTGRLAPIGFDGNLQMRRPIGRLVAPQEPIVARFLADGAVLAAFGRRLREVCTAVETGELTARLAAVQARVLPILQSEYLFLQEYQLAELRARAEALVRVRAEAFLAAGGGDRGLEPLLVSAVGGDRFELRNVAPWPVQVLGLRWLRPDGSVVAAALPPALRPQAELAAKPAAGPIPDLCLTVPRPADAAGASLQVEAALGEAGAEPAAPRHWITAVPQPPSATSPSIPSTGAAELIAAWPWLRLKDDGVTLLAEAGTHHVERTLVTPPGFRVEAGPGTRLLFGKEAAFVVQGEVLFAGSAAAPIELGPADGTWPGVLVLAPAAASAVSWRHVRVAATSGVVVGVLSLTGGVVFHRGKVTLADVFFSGTTAEDAVNAIHAEVAITATAIERTRSDAFDGDFVRGELSDCTFTDIGGDAIDVSGSTVRVARCRVHTARDKALSVGEASTVTAEQLVAQDTGVGVACKDGSTLSLSRSRILAPHHAGVMSYVKKPEYGACRSTLTEVVVEGFVPEVRVAHGCVVIRDGVVVPSETIDVEALYSTIMRK